MLDAVFPEMGSTHGCAPLDKSEKENINQSKHYTIQILIIEAQLL